MNKKTILDALPETAKVIAEVIGASETLALSERLYERRHFINSDACATLSIPKSMGWDHWIMETLGPRTAAKLCKVFGGEKLPLARCRSVARKKRNAEILDMVKSGSSIQQAAEKFNLSARSVMFIAHPLQAKANRERIKARRRANRNL